VLLRQQPVGHRFEIAILPAVPISVLPAAIIKGNVYAKAAADRFLGLGKTKLMNFIDELVWTFKVRGIRQAI
jgi:hypothetical protein